MQSPREAPPNTHSQGGLCIPFVSIYGTHCFHHEISSNFVLFCSYWMQSLHGGPTRMGQSAKENTRYRGYPSYIRSRRTIVGALQTASDARDRPTTAHFFSPRTHSFSLNHVLIFVKSPCWKSSCEITLDRSNVCLPGPWAMNFLMLSVLSLLFHCVSIITFKMSGFLENKMLLVQQ